MGALLPEGVGEDIAGVTVLLILSEINLICLL
jgi:hypothetical protein